LIDPLDGGRAREPTRAPSTIEGGTPVTQTLSTPAPARERSEAPATRIGAVLGIAAVVLMMGGLAIEAPADAVNSNPAADIVGYFTGGDLPRKFTGGLVVCLGFLLFLPFAATVTSRLRGAAAAGMLAPTAQMAATAYVIISLAPGQAAGAAALWLGRSGSADPAAVLALNDLRAFSFYVSLLALAAFLIAVGAAVVTGGGLPRWAGWAALAVGATVAVGVPVAQTGLAEIASLLGLVWMIAVAVTLLRRPTAE
jgi:hypothetical protein